LSPMRSHSTTLVPGGTAGVEVETNVAG